MTPNKLKDKLEKKEAELKDLKKKVKDAELAEQKAQENLAKLEAKKDEIRDAVQAVLDQASVVLPSGKSITITPSQTGLIADVSDLKQARKGGGNGGAKTIIYEGREMSWQQLADEKGIDTKGASAHKVIFLKARQLHDSIPHENCPYK